MALIWYSSEGSNRFPMETLDDPDFETPYGQLLLAEMCAAALNERLGATLFRWPRNITVYASELGPEIFTAAVFRQLIPSFVAQLPGPFAEHLVPKWSAKILSTGDSITTTGERQ